MEKMREETFAEKAKVAKQELDLQRLQGTIDRLTKSLQTSEKSIQLFDKKFKEKKGALKQVSTRLREKTRSFAESKKAWEDDANKRNELEKKVQSQRQVIDKLSKEKRDLSTKKIDMETAFTTQLDDFTRTNKALQQQVAQLEGRIGNLTRQIEDQQADFAAAEKLTKGARSETKAQKSKNVKLGQRILSLEEKIEELNGEIQRLVAENEKHQKDLKECLEHKETLTNEAKALEAEVRKYKKQKRALDKIKDTDEFAPKNSTRRKPTRRTSRIGRPQVRQMVLTPKDVPEEIAKQIAKLTNREFSLRKKNANVQALLKAIKGRLQDKRPLKDDETNKRKLEKQVQANKKKINLINKQIQELKNIEDYNFIDDEIRHIQTAIENNRQRWENLKNQTEAQQMLKDTKKIIKSYEYNKVDSKTVNIGGRNVNLKEREIESPRIKEFNNALEKLSVDDAQAFFEGVLNQNEFPKGTFSRLLDKARAEKDNPQEPNEQTDRLDSFMDSVPDRGINAGGFQIRLRF